MMETTIGMLQKILIICGILAPLLYLGSDRITGGLIKGYKFSLQSMSDVIAIGSPQRMLAVSLTIIASVFMTAFGIGAWLVSDQVVLIRVVSLLVIGNAISGLIANLFFPNRYGERPNFLSVGVIIMFTGVILFILAMVVGAVAINGWFRIISIAIPVAYVLLAILRFTTARIFSTREVSLLIGAQERTMMYSYLVWVLILAIYLMSLW